MNNINNQTDLNDEKRITKSNFDRTFQDPDAIISGKSVIVENSLVSERNNNISQDMWPYNLTDYLKSFIGKIVQIEYVLSNGRCCEKRGELQVTGTNFIGMQLNQTNDLFLLDLDSIKSINVFNYKGIIKSRNNRY